MRLQAHLGAKPSIWRDPRLQGNEFFEDTLLEAVPKVAILVSILSPSYINSKWCRREMELFSQIARDTGGVRLGNKARIFKVEKLPVPQNNHPQDLQGMTGWQAATLRLYWCGHLVINHAHAGTRSAK